MFTLIELRYFNPTLVLSLGTPNGEKGSNLSCAEPKFVGPPVIGTQRARNAAPNGMMLHAEWSGLLETGEMRFARGLLLPLIGTVRMRCDDTTQGATREGLV